MLFSNKVSAAPTVTSSASLSTTPVKLNLPTGKINGAVNIKISNLHASQLVAFTVVDLGAAAPTVNATLADAACGAVIPPGRDVEIVIGQTKDVYVVGSAASTSFAAWAVCN
jgi:hypothetical protein